MTYGSVAIDQIVTSVANTSLGAGNASIMKNRIINGAMVIDQRNAGASVTPLNGDYTLDRWSLGLSQTSKVSVQQNAGSVTPPIGFSNYLGVTSLSAYSVGSTDTFNIQQKIEGFNTADLGWGTANAKTVTLSFQVYSSLTGTFGGSLRNSAANYSYPFSYSISTANTWTTISVTIVGPTVGTWIGATNGIGINLVISLGTGTTNSGTAGSWSANNYNSVTGATSVVGTNGATFYITGVQLEVGSSATGYEYRQYGTELILCQRYFYQNTGSTAYAITQSNNGTNRLRGSTSIPVVMRATPTLTFATTSSWYTYNGNAPGAYSSIAQFSASANQTNILIDVIVTIPNGNLSGSYDWFVVYAISAEL